MKLLIACLTVLFAGVAGANIGAGEGEFPTQCDINGDGIFSFTADYGNFLLVFQGLPVDDPRIPRASDLNHDGRVTTQDFGVMMAECPIPVNAQ